MASTAAGLSDPRRRLSRRARRDQLVAAAMPLLARQGPMELSLDAVARRAGVTRNLLYHYFPGGRIDLVAAATEEAERQLLGPGGAASGPLPPADGQDALSRILDHALAPTHAWRIHRMARAAGGPAAREIVERSTERVAGALAAVLRPGEQPSPVPRLVLRAYVAFAETVLEEARTSGIARDEIRDLLGRTLTALSAAG